MKIFEGNIWGINLETVECPQCGKKMPMIRVPKDLHEVMWGGWTCPECSCKMDKWGKLIAEDESKI